MGSIFSNSSNNKALMYGLGAQQLGQTAAINSINDAEPKSLAALGNGYGQARGAYQGASDLFAPYAQAGQGALTAYQGSLGLGGQGAYDSAVNSFHTSPGFTQRQDLATDAVARQASATGALGSGNTLQAITDRAYQLGDAEYGNWQGQLQGLAGMGLSATGSQAGLQKGIGDLYAAQGTGEAGIYGNDALARANVYTGTANQTSNLWSNYGQHADDASKNAWSLGLGALSAVANGAGKAAGSGAFSGLTDGWMPKY